MLKRIQFAYIFLKNWTSSPVSQWKGCSHNVVTEKTKHTKIITIFVRYFERQNAIRGKMPRAPILCLPWGFHSLSGHAHQIKPGSCETIATAIKLPPQRNATKRIFICLSKYIDQKRYCTVSNTRSHKKPPAWRITSKKWSSGTYLKYFTLEWKFFT